MSSEKPVVIVGAGLAGSLLACYLAKRGYQVAVFERRPDSRTVEITAGRSINLALSTRGRTALAGVGLEDEIVAQGIPMSGRRMHAKNGDLSYQPYGNSTQAILSVGRRDINEALMTAAERYENVTFTFGAKCVGLDIKNNKASFVIAKDSEMAQMAQGGPAKGASGRALRVFVAPDDSQASGGDDEEMKITVDAQVIVGGDGAFSMVRSQMMKAHSRFNFSQEFISHGYKELTIPPTPSGDFALPPDGLHIWPRGDYMMIALPNVDKTFTCTIFMDLKDFDALDSDEKVSRWMKEEFGDAVALMPDMIEEWNVNPVSNLVGVKCYPWNIGGNAVLIGDAAHAIVPFYGQGMNASMEDVAVLDRLLGEHKGDWEKTFNAYTEIRKPCGDAVWALSLHNYIEMRSKVASSSFLLRKRFEAFLHGVAPEKWIPLYSMVSFTNIQYDEVVRRAEKQDAILSRVGKAAKYLGLAAVLGGAAWYAKSKEIEIPIKFGKSS